MFDSCFLFKLETSNKFGDSDVLDKQKCLDALASLRHAKWFQVGLIK